MNIGVQMHILMIQHRILYKIAKAYYEKRLTQQEIANRYGLSRMKVSRLLAKAVNEKIVQIRIITPNDQFTDLEHQLEEKYGMKEVVITNIKTNNEKDLFQEIGRTSAEYLISILQGNEIICLTWGRTLLNLINNLSAQEYPGLKVAQMLGGLGEPEAEFHGTDLARRMAQIFTTRPRLIHAPGILKNKKLCDELKEDIQVKNTLLLAAKANIAVVGIGSFTEGGTILKSNILTEKDKQTLNKHNVTGDISLRFFNKEGQFINTELDDRIVGLSTDEILNIPRIIGVAGGLAKYNSIKAAVKGKLISVLITDHNVAERLANERL